jgi:hypothetical protein
MLEAWNYKYCSMYVNYSWTVALLDGVPAEALLDGVQEPRRRSADLHL